RDRRGAGRLPPARHLELRSSAKPVTRTAVDADLYWAFPMLGIFNRLIDSNEREVKRLWRFVEEINALEPEFQRLSDEDIRARMATLRAAIVEEAAPEEPGEDELDAEDQERRWELARERRKRDLEALREALDER